MRIDYPDNSFSLYWQNASAWYDEKGNLIDCEKKLRRGGCIVGTRAISEKHTHVREWLKRQGKREAELLNSGMLKRK